MIKELKEKIKERNYLRIAVRDTHDNNRLLAVLREELGIK